MSSCREPPNVVLAQKGAETLSPLDRTSRRWDRPERLVVVDAAPMRPLKVVEPAIFTQNRLEVLLVDDWHSVEALSATAPIHRSAWAFGLGAKTGVQMIRAPSDLNTTSAWGANFLCRSWSATLSSMPSSSNF